ELLRNPAARRDGARCGRGLREVRDRDVDSRRSRLGFGAACGPFVSRTISCEGGLAGEHLEQERAEAVKIALRVAELAAELLGARAFHERDAAPRRTLARDARTGQAVASCVEEDCSRLAVRAARDDDVLELERAVREALLMKGLERLEDAAEQGLRLVQV